MKKYFTILAIALFSSFAMAQTNQYFWAGGQFIMGNPINQIDSVTFGQLENTDSIMLYLPHTVKVVHDTVIQYVTIHDTINVCPEELPWKGLIIEAEEDKTIVAFNYILQPKQTSPFDENTIPGNLYYSYDAVKWIEWMYNDSIELKKGQKICVKGNRSYYTVLDQGNYGIEITSGAIKVYGYISSLFDNGDECISTKYPNSVMSQFFRGKATVTLSIPEGVTEIGTSFIYSYAFAYDSIDAVELPSTLTYIGCTCFEGNHFTEITIPVSVKTIGYIAFGACPLKDIYYEGTKSQWNSISVSKQNLSCSSVLIHCTDGDISIEDF